MQDLFAFAYARKFNLYSHRKRKRSSQSDCNRQYVKRPPNAFMIYRKEQRPHVVAETNITDCAAVNKILGQKVSKSHKKKPNKCWTYLMADKWLEPLPCCPYISCLWYLALSCASCVDSGKWWPGKSRQNTMKRPKEKEPCTLSCIQTGLPKTITYVHKWHLCSSWARVAWTKSSKKCPVSVDNFQIFVIVVGKYAKKSSEEDFKRWVSFCWFYCKPYLITG